jgi:hypothetical protein
MYTLGRQRRVDAMRTTEVSKEMPRLIYSFMILYSPLGVEVSRSDKKLEALVTKTLTSLVELSGRNSMAEFRRDLAEGNG